MINSRQDVRLKLEELSDTLDLTQSEVSVILSAGPGKRIKSEKSKMLHKIWGKPTVCRVAEAALNGLGCGNQIIVVGDQGLEVAHALGKRKNRIFIFQEEQKGTGDAVREAIQHNVMAHFEGTVYIFPGDMGLLSETTIAQFHHSFLPSDGDMMVMTGIYQGPLEENKYGRIIKSKNNNQEIIAIKEYRDIAALGDGDVCTINHNHHQDTFKKNDLLSITEFNTGVYAFKSEPLKELVSRLTSENVQSEIYATDLIRIFRGQDLRVLSFPVVNKAFVMAFNVKSVLKKMEDFFRGMVYDKLKDIIVFESTEDFFIAEETVQRIVELDKQHSALDVKIGKGVHLGENVFLSRGVTIERNSRLEGNVKLGENVYIGENVEFSTYPEQVIAIGRNSQIFSGNVFKGHVEIGNRVRIETGVRITGSKDHPAVIGKNALIKGITYILGSIIERDVVIQHSVLENVYVEKVLKKDGAVRPVRYILPHAEGMDSITPLKDLGSD